MAATKSDQNAKSIINQDTDVGEMHVLRNLSKYLWPKGQPGVKARVVTAFTLLAAAKVYHMVILDGTDSTRSQMFVCPTCSNLLLMHSHHPPLNISSMAMHSHH